MPHEDLSPATGEIEDKHFWLVLHDGLVCGSGWPTSRAADTEASGWAPSNADVPICA